MRLLAPAKINLHLRVAPPAGDGSGFHPLVSWMCTVALFDKLTIERTDPTELSLVCDLPSIPCDEANLVFRAAQAMQSQQPPPGAGARMLLEKRIPPGGGLGGGSSDAAAALLGLNRLWDMNLPVQRLAEIAANLGSDVPFFLNGPSSICTGRGEIVRPVRRPRPPWAVLVFPGLAIPTPSVYRKFDELRLGLREAIDTEPDWDQWAILSAGPLLAGLVNDLETPAFVLCPQLAALREAIERTLNGRIVRMSGSGSSLFTLFDRKGEATAAAERIMDCHNVGAMALRLAPDCPFEDETATASASG